jgi:tetratricopeptide (TPR) repeat protein
VREPSVRATTARDRAGLLASEKRFSEAETLLRAAAQEAKATEDAASQYVTLQALAELLRSQERRVEAVPIFLEALSACVQAQGTADELGRLQASLAFTFVNIGLPDQATEHAAVALSLAESMGRLDERIRALNAVALTNTRLGHFRSARSLYSQIIRDGRGRGGPSEEERGRAMRPSHPVRHFIAFRNQRLCCSALRSALLVLRFGMATRLTRWRSCLSMRSVI